MSFAIEIKSGLECLERIRNLDSGWPALKPGDISGAWSTGEALWVSLLVDSSPNIPELLRTVELLLKFQQHDGGWPLIQGPPSSVPGTSDCIVALFRIRPAVSDEKLRKRIDQSIQSGLQWLKQQQNEDGGWGIEPEKGEVRRSRVFGTYYSLRALLATGEIASSECVRKGIDYLLDARNQTDGSWGYEKGKLGDVSNTARAMLCLLETGKLSAEDRIMREALSFILKFSPGQLWGLTEERITRSGGLLVLDNFPTYDALRALLKCNYLGEETLRCLQWIVKIKGPNGCWRLVCPLTNREKESLSWVTSEVIHALSLADSLIKASPRLLLETAFHLASDTTGEADRAQHAQQPEVKSECVIGYGGKPYKTFVSKNVGDFLLLLLAIAAGVGVYQAAMLQLTKVISLLGFKVSVFSILMLFSTYFLVYARAGRIRDIKEMDRLKFYTGIGSVAVALVAILVFLF